MSSSEFFLLCKHLCAMPAPHAKGSFLLSRPLVPQSVRYYHSRWRANQPCRHTNSRPVGHRVALPVSLSEGLSDRLLDRLSEGLPDSLSAYQMVRQCVRRPPLKGMPRSVSDGLSAGLSNSVSPSLAAGLSASVSDSLSEDFLPRWSYIATSGNFRRIPLPTS